jgi:hydrogenase maturation protease
MTERRVVVGVGNALRGDDAVGIVVAERLRERVPDDVDIVECEQEPSRLLDAWRDADLAVVVDACSSGRPPGTVHRFDASGDPLPARVFRSSTHAFGVGDAVELARALDRLPRQIVIYGVEGGQFTAGTGLSPEVESAIEQVAEEVVRELQGDGPRA